ncbi:MAG: radical SAM family heme chaperone HemW [Verrucomicrobiota bacterium]
MHLYVHIPFCHHICPYCGFYKHKPGGLANREFIEAILAEAKRRGAEISAPVKTIFIGGGTPSLLSRPQLELLCTGLSEAFDLSQLEEWSLEANPKTFRLAKAKCMRELGITRVSLGVQSFHSETLATLGRDHTPEDAVSAYETLREAGFPSVSVDLMFSIPGQNMESWKSDLDEAIRLQPDHVSAYNLTYEEDTEFLQRHESGELDVDGDRDADLFYEAIDRLEAAGFRHYEISNYAQPGHESIHNRAYWSGADYLGLGPGAVSTLRNERSTTLPDTATYVKAALAGLDTRTAIETITAEDKRLERIALQLRTREGLPLEFLPTSNPVGPLIEEGLVRVSAGSLQLTRDGKALADSVAAALV